MIDLVRGQRVKLSDLTTETRLTIGIHLEGMDRSQIAGVALLLGDTHEAISPTAVVCDERPRSDCGGLVFQAAGGVEQTFHLDIERLTAAASNVLFAVAITGQARSARDIRRGHLQISAGGQIVARYLFTGRDFGDEASIALGEVYRKSDVWRIRAIGDGFVGGLPAMLSRYKLTPTRVGAPPGGPLPGGPLPGGPLPGSAPGVVSIARAWPGERAPVVPKDLTRSVGLIVARTAQGKVHTGTGFIVTPGGHFITCNHVVEDAELVGICIDGTRLLRPAEIIARDPESDLAMCWMVDRNGSPDWLVVAGPDVTPALGDDLGLLGFPLGVDLGLSVTYSQGIVNSLRTRGAVSVLQIDVGAAPGSSGGPVFRRSDGRVLGVLTSGLSAQERGMLINFAVDIRMIWRLGWLA